MELPDELLLLPHREAVRRIALAQLEHACAAAERALDPTDAGGLHAFRVALRRLRTTLRLWKEELADVVRRKHRRALREIQSATGAGRDAEVGLAWIAEQKLDGPGERWIAEELRRRLSSATSGLRESLSGEFARHSAELRARLGVFEQRVHLTGPPAGATHAAALAARVRLQSAELVDHLLAVGAQSDREAQHAARIELKRLRYIVEPALGRVDGAEATIEDCKRLQDLLGRLNDAHVLGSELERAMGGDEVPHSLARDGLRELALRVEGEREHLYAELDAQWLGVRTARIADHAQALCAALERAARGSVEIERKYLLSSLPRLPWERTTLEIEQGWLPGTLLRERLRRTRTPAGTTYHRALKLGRGVVRTEIEEETTKELFEALWPLTAGCRVRKLRHRVTVGELVWELDEFTDRELVLAEVELPSPDAPAVPPAWLAPHVVREVTEERGFTNLELAR